MPCAETLRQRLVTLFADDLKLEVPSVDTDLFESGILDSLSFVELLMRLEHTFGVTTSVEDLEIDTFRSIARIADFVLERTCEEPRRPPHTIVALGTAG
jgi:acyl carrier protein